MKIRSLEKILFLRYRRTVEAEKKVLVQRDGGKFDKNLKDRQFHLKSKRGCVFMRVLAITTSDRYVCISSTTLTDADASRRDVCDFIVPRYSTTERDLATYLHQHSCNCMSRIYNHNNDMQVLHDCVHGRDMHICIYICLLFSPRHTANQFAFGNASIIDCLCVHIYTQMNIGFPKYYFEWWIHFHVSGYFGR